MTVALILLIVAVSCCAIGLISGTTWWFVMVGVGALILGTLGLARWLGVPRFVVPLIGIAEFLILLTLAFAPRDAIAGIIPTPRTFGEFSEIFTRAMLSIQSQPIPAKALPEFLYLITLVTGMLSLLFDFLASTVRKPALTAFAVAFVLVVPSVLLPTGLSPLALVACAACYLLVLRVDTRIRRRGWGEPGVALSVAAAATVVALLVATTAPGFAQVGRGAAQASGLTIGSGVNPLIDLGQDLRRPAPVTVMHYTTTSDTQPYLRLTSLDQFTGTVWRHASQPVQPLPVGSIRRVLGLDSSVRTRVTHTDVHIDNMVSSWLPAPYPISGVGGLSGRWSWSPGDLTVSAENTNTDGQTYRASGLDIMPTPTELRNAVGETPASVQRDLFVPFDVPQIITNTAEAVTKNTTNDYDRAVALQNFFQNDGFSYSTKAPVENSYDGDSMQSIAAFLKVKSGYCVHFASAMAMMARLLGIPARIGMGYLPGTIAGVANGQAQFSITSDDLHAWPELYFAGIGWVPFEPTVTRGSLPAYSIPGATDASSTTSASAPTPSQSSRAAAPHDPTTTAQAGAHTPGEAITATVSTVIVVLFFVALLLLPAGVRRWQRVNRLRRLRDEWGHPALAWQEVRASARDLGMAVPDTETPRAFARRLSSLLGDDPVSQNALSALLDAQEREEYGRPGHGILDADRAGSLRIVVDRMLVQAGMPARVRALLTPASLLPDMGRLVRGRARLSA